MYGNMDLDLDLDAAPIPVPTYLATGGLMDLASACGLENDLSEGEAVDSYSFELYHQNQHRSPKLAAASPKLAPMPEEPVDEGFFQYLTEEELANFRSQICEAVSKGDKCLSEDRCLFSHCLAWQRRNPYTTPYLPEQCPNISFAKRGDKMTLINNCTAKRRCKFAHSKEEQLYHPATYKMKQCVSFPNCRRPLCPFAHSSTEVRDLEALKDKLAMCTPDKKETAMAHNQHQHHHHHHQRYNNYNNGYDSFYMPRMRGGYPRRPHSMNGPRMYNNNNNNNNNNSGNNHHHQHHGLRHYQQHNYHKDNEYFHEKGPMKPHHGLNNQNQNQNYNVNNNNNTSNNSNNNATENTEANDNTNNQNNAAASPADNNQGKNNNNNSNNSNNNSQNMAQSGKPHGDRPHRHYNQNYNGMNHGYGPRHYHMNGNYQHQYNGPRRGHAYYRQNQHHNNDLVPEFLRPESGNNNNNNGFYQNFASPPATNSGRLVAAMLDHLEPENEKKDATSKNHNNKQQNNNNKAASSKKDLPVKNDKKEETAPTESQTTKPGVAVARGSFQQPQQAQQQQQPQQPQPNGENEFLYAAQPDNKHDAFSAISALWQGAE